MNKDRDRQTKTAPPRVSDEFRRLNFLRQTGLKLPHSARQRRRLASSR